MSSNHEKPSRSRPSQSGTPRLEANGTTNIHLDLEEFALKYRPFLKGIASTEFPMHLAARVDDSDIVQETLFKATAQLGQFQGRSDAEMKAWLREILLNQIKDNVRFHARQQRDVGLEQFMPMAEVHSSGSSASAVLRDGESRERIWKAINELSEDQKTVIIMRLQTNSDFGEIGEKMHRSADAVRMLWGRALVILGQKLTDRDR